MPGLLKSALDPNLHVGNEGKSQECLRKKRVTSGMEAITTGLNKKTKRSNYCTPLSSGYSTSMAARNRREGGFSGGSRENE